MPQAPTTREAEPDFLTREVSTRELRDACVRNHIDWMRRLAAASGGANGHEPGLFWAHLPRPVPEFHIVVLDPPSAQLRDRFDAVVDRARDLDVDRVGCWLVDADEQARSGGWAGGHGFRPDGRPHWMALDLHTVPAGGDDIVLTVVDRLTDVTAPGLCAFDEQTAAIRESMAAESPRRVWQLVQWQDGEPAGQISVITTTGELGVAGLHDLVVLPDARTNGLGTSRFLALCRFLTDLGVRYAVLNADGNPALYRLFGFRSLGFGRTWWLSGDRLTAPADPDGRAVADAITDADLAVLSGLRGRLNRRLPNGMTAVEFAAAVPQPASTTWLVDNGAPLDVLSAWDLGWRDTASDLLSEPSVRDAQRPRSGKSLLHVAVERDDRALVQLLLAAGIDTDLRDHRFGGTALDWATALQRPRMAALLASTRTGEQRVG